MERTLSRDTVVALARSALMAVAPEESESLDPAVQAYFRRPRRRDGRSLTEHLLSLATAESVPTLTTAALGAAQAAVTLVHPSDQDSPRPRQAGRNRLIARLRNRRPDPAAPEDPTPDAPVSPAVLKQIRGTAHQQARSLGATIEQATLIADAILGHLAAPRPETH